MYNHENRSISLEQLRNSKTAVVNHFLILIFNLNSITFVSQTEPTKNCNESLDVIGTICHSELPAFVQLLVEFVSNSLVILNQDFKHLSISGPNFNITNINFKDNFVLLDQDNALILACVLNDNLWRQYMTTPKLQLSIAEISKQMSQQEEGLRETLYQGIVMKSPFAVDVLNNSNCNMQLVDLILSNPCIFVAHTMLKAHLE